VTYPINIQELISRQNELKEDPLSFANEEETEVFPFDKLKTNMKNFFEASERAYHSEAQVSIIFTLHAMAISKQHVIIQERKTHRTFADNNPVSWSDRELCFSKPNELTNIGRIDILIQRLKKPVHIIELKAYKKRDLNDDMFSFVEEIALEDENQNLNESQSIISSPTKSVNESQMDNESPSKAINEILIESEDLNEDQMNNESPSQNANESPNKNVNEAPGQNMNESQSLNQNQENKKFESKSAAGCREDGIFNLEDSLKFALEQARSSYNYSEGELTLDEEYEIPRHAIVVAPKKMLYRASKTGYFPLEPLEMKFKRGENPVEIMETHENFAERKQKLMNDIGFRDYDLSFKAQNYLIPENAEVVYHAKLETESELIEFRKKFEQAIFFELKEETMKDKGHEHMSAKEKIEKYFTRENLKDHVEVSVIRMRQSPQVELRLKMKDPLKVTRVKSLLPNIMMTYEIPLLSEVLSRQIN